jgi:P-type conjugative transfer protein TrbJ
MLNVLRLKLAHCVKQNRTALRRKKANDAVLRLLTNSRHLQSDADNLADLQTQATGAQGQMEAIQAANQLASAQTNQLLQIRSLLVAQQNAAATLAQAQADKEAQQIAADEKALAGQNTPSPKRIW